MHNNPGNSELLFDLGWLYQENFHDASRARNVWMAALRCWEAQSANVKANPGNQLICEKIAMNLARMEESEENWPQAIKFLEIVRQVSPNPDAIQKQIDEARKAMAAQPSTPATPLH